MIPRMRSREALVTGVGVVNAIANDFESFVGAMREGRCGQRAIIGFDPGGLRNPRACEAAEFDPGPVYERRDSRKMDRSSELLLAAFDQAVAMARVDLRSVAPTRGAVAMGSTLGGAVTGFRYYRAAREGSRRPSKLRDHSMHAPGYRVCIDSGFLGPNLVFSTACTSSNLALAAALDLVRADKADVVVAGGFEPLSLISCAGFSVMRNVTPGICRPFDRNRDGLVLGEGSAVLIVEADDFAARRGARALAAIRACPGPRFYFDLLKEVKGQRRGQTGLTPAVALVQALNRTSREMVDQGLDRILEQVEVRARCTRRGLDALGFRQLSSAPANALTACFPPPGIDAARLIRNLQERFGIVVAGGQGELKGKIIRIGHLGYFDLVDVFAVISAIEICLLELGAPTDLGSGIKGAMREAVTPVFS